jgi:hypothetical protein
MIETLATIAIGAALAALYATTAPVWAKVAQWLK